MARSRDLTLISLNWQEYSLRVSRDPALDRVSSLKVSYNQRVNEQREAGVMDFLRKYIPKNFEKYLQGIDFPIGKQELVGKLEQNGAPSIVVSQVSKRLPEGQYKSPQDLIKHLRG